MTIQRSRFIPRDYDVFAGLDVDKKSMAVVSTHHEALRQAGSRLSYSIKPRPSATAEIFRELGLTRFFIEVFLGPLGSLAEHHSIPAIHHIEMDIELVEDPHRGVVDQVFEVLRMIVESGDGRQNHDTHPRQLQHVLKMNLMQRRLAHDQH